MEEQRRLHKVLIDPGHGGKDTGAVYPWFTSGGAGKFMHARLLESELNLHMAGLLSNALMRIGKGSVLPVLTRTTDVRMPISTRLTTDDSWEQPADAFISIHHNAGPQGATGAEIFRGPDPADEALANAIWAQMLPVLDEHKLRNRGIKTSSQSQHPSLPIIDRNDAPAVLIELCFPGNFYDQDRMLNEDYHLDAADAIAAGVLSYIRGE